MGSQIDIAVKPKSRNRRGEKARQDIVDSTIKILNQVGYGATSIDAVMADCNLGRGSILNQFPNRHALMIATGERAMSQMVATATCEVVKIDGPEQQVRSLFDVFWETHNLPEAIALTEILLASRWDRALADGLSHPAEQMETVIDELHAGLAEQAGIIKSAEFVVHGRLLNSNLRGITIELMLKKDREMIHSALASLKNSHLSFVASLLPS